MRKPRRLTSEELAPYCWDMPKRDRLAPRELCAIHPFDWPQFFGNANPIEIEVGMGKGLFLLTQAMTRPEVNFLGIEVVRKYQLYAATRYAIRNLPNAKTTCADAKVVLRDFVATGSVAAVHVLFPDPWWKSRHKKRRLFTDEFADLLARVVQHGGHVHSWTDVAEYFEVISALMNHHAEFEALPPAPEPEPGRGLPLWCTAIAVECRANRFPSPARSGAAWWPGGAAGEQCRRSPHRRSRV